MMEKCGRKRMYERKIRVRSSRRDVADNSEKVKKRRNDSKLEVKEIIN
jgi:hypothetical protein